MSLQPDAPISDDDRRLVEDQAAFRDDSPGAHAAEREALRGLTPPPGQLPHLRYFPGELFDRMPWRGHRVEVLAVPLEPGSRIPVSHPWEFEQFPKIEGPCLVVRWRVRDSSKPGFLEITWDRRGRGRIARRIGEVGGAVTAAHARRLWALWSSRRRTAIPTGARKAGGRKHGWRCGLPLTGKDLVDWYREASEYHANHGRVPSLRDLAQRLQVRHHDTAKKRWEERTRLPWPPPPGLLEEDDDEVI